MKKLKRLAAVLLAGIMALALFTACSDSSDPGNPEFDPKVERAYLDALNTAIEELRADGTLKTLSEKYFGQDISSEN